MKIEEDKEMVEVVEVQTIFNKTQSKNQKKLKITK